jgi:hypothetical protein
MKYLLLMLLFVFVSSNADYSIKEIIVSNNSPNKKCTYINQITSNSGNSVFGGFIPNEDLEKTALNRLREKAKLLGENYIEIVISRSGLSGKKNSFSQTSVTYVGNVFKCNNK